MGESQIPLNKKTLFVRNLPFSTTSKDLLNAFEKFGPIKTCYVVNDKESKQSRGIGYVKFTDDDDASKAYKEVKVINGRKIYISLAQPKRLTIKAKEKSSATGQGLQKVIVRNLPFVTGSDVLANLLKDVGTVASIELPKDEQGKAKGYGIVCFHDKETAEKAIKSLDNTEVGGRKISLSWFIKQSEFNKVKKKSQTDQSGPVKGKKKEQSYRIIIRNMPFQLTEEALKQQLSTFGNVLDVKVPTSSDGKKKGFAFVSFDDKQAAEKAISQVKELGKRPVAVDWAIDKNIYTKQGHADGDKQVEEVKDKNSEKLAPKGKNNKNNKMTEEKKPIKSSKDKQADLSDEDDSGSSEEELESSSETDNEESSNDEEELQGEEDAQSSNSGSDADAGEEEKSDDQSSTDDEEETTNSESNVKKKREYKTSSADITQQRTLFIRNVAYETTEESIEELFSQFGEVSYAKVLINPLTERSKGMAFVQFKSKKDADDCITAAQDPLQISKFLLDGRDLNVALAVSREKIGEISQQKEKQPKDKRNLYLAREGLIRAGTKAAEGVSKNDLNKRTKLETRMRAKLKNPLIFISPVRLCIHNLPVKLTDKSLKLICLKAVGENRKQARITECRIMRDLTVVNSEGIAKSRGFGFVTFTQHEHAIAALRKLNNNPQTFTDEKRPIVEFSLENLKVLQAKEKRLQSAKLLMSANTRSRKPANPNLSVAKLLNSNNVEIPAGVKPGLPSHFGPKIRHKQRGTAPIDSRKAARMEKKKKQEEWIRKEKEESRQPKPKKRKAEASDDFDKLVDSYKKKMFSTPAAKSKWYE